MTSIKIVFGSDIRRFKIDPQLATPFQYISKVILQTYGPDLEIRYEDDEGDLCLITSEDEMKEALRLISGSKPLKLKLQSKVSVLPVDDLDGLSELSDLKVSTELPAVSTELLAVSTELPAVSTELPAVSTELPASEKVEEAVAVKPEAPAEKRVEETVAIKPESTSEPLVEEKVEEKAEAVSEAAEEESDVHLSVVCDACNVTPIVGVRYRCYVCKRVDLCSACEAKNVHAPDHVLLKMKTPVAQDFKFEHRQMASEEKQSPPKAEFVRDGNITDGSTWKRGQKITKIWVFKNNGKSSWPRSRLAHVGGPMKPLPDQPLIPLAAPGEIVSLSLNFQLPDQPGRVTSYFRLVDEGTGKKYGPRIWIDVIVGADSFLDTVTTFFTGSRDRDAKATAPKPAPKPDFPYEKELTVLQDMGFSDEARLKELLLKHNGHVQTVANVYIS